MGLFIIHWFINAWQCPFPPDGVVFFINAWQCPFPPDGVVFDPRGYYKKKEN